MGRPKGGKNKYWSKEEKLKLIKEHLDNNKSTNEITTRENISNGMYNNWLKKYLELGDAGLENKKKPGNPLAKYQSKKQLTDIEKLEYENMKLRIENERLKKGYWVEGDGQVVIFNGSKNKNSK
jgi:transposase-like protein